MLALFSPGKNNQPMRRPLPLPALVSSGFGKSAPPNHFARKSCLDNSEKRCNMTFRDPKPPTVFPQETEN